MSGTESSASSNSIERRRAAVFALNAFPKSIVNDLLEDHDFRVSLGFSAETVITFGPEDVSFKHTDFFNALRIALARESEPFKIRDVKEREWVIDTSSSAEQIQIRLKHEERSFNLPAILAVLSPNRDIRLSVLEGLFNECHLTAQDAKVWRERISEGVPQDETLSDLLTAINQTPIRMQNLIVSALRRGNFDLETMVPKSADYYEQLVGRCEAHVNIDDYSKSVGADHINGLIAWRRKEGFLWSLLAGSHTFVSRLIDASLLDDCDLVEAYQWIQQYGDRISQTSALEIGLSMRERQSLVEPYLANLVVRLRDDAVEGSASRYRLMSALIVLVEGELACAKVLDDKPPFWRRMAAIAHAGLIERCVIESGINFDGLCDWAMKARSPYFYVRNMLDLRREPRWYPDYLTEAQLKNEVLGRIYGAASSNGLQLESPALKALLLEEPNSIESVLKLPEAFLPGPLEGGLASMQPPPESLMKDIQDSLSATQLDVHAFAVLLNSASLFRYGEKEAELAAKAIREAKYQIHGEGKSVFFLLLGLAKLAAITRSPNLSSEVRVLARRGRRSPGPSLTGEESFWVGMIAAASYSSPEEWSTFLGDWITELAFEELVLEELNRIKAHVTLLLELRPNLWPKFARGHAALSCAVAS